MKLHDTFKNFKLMKKKMAWVSLEEGVDCMYGLQNCIFEGLFYMYMYIYMCKVNILNSSQIVVFYAGGAELS